MSKPPAFPFKPHLLCGLLCLTFPVGAYAQETAAEASTETAVESADAKELQEVNVRGRRPVQNLGQERVRRTHLDQNLVHDAQDLVRYEPGVSVAEGDRGNSSGFAIRGVDKDRVAITVDGLAQAESRSSEGFQELFGAYGNFNVGRNAAEIETIREVQLQKGADSLSAGSGALGGAVMYQTKSPRDYVDEDKPFYASVKDGHISKSKQNFASVSVGGYFKGFDGLLVYTKRRGHETQNHSKSADDFPVRYRSAIGAETYSGILRTVPDEQNVNSKSTLLKLGYHFNPSNYLGWVYEDFRQDRITDERSNLLQSFTRNGVRYRNDVNYRKRYGLNYENALENGPWDSLKVNLDRQRVDMTTLTWDLNREMQRRNDEAFFRRRGLFQNTDNLALAAEKHLVFERFPSFSWDLSYGAGYGKTKNTNDNLEYHVFVTNPTVPSGNPDSQEFLISSQRINTYAYWNNTLRFGSKWKLGLGARYDLIKMNTLESDSLNYHVRRKLYLKGLWNQQSTFKAPSYTATLDWTPVQALTLQAKYSTGFRAPTTDEMWFYFDSPDVVLIEPNPNLKREKAQNTELGFNLRGGWGNFKLSGFRTQYRDFIYLSETAAMQQAYQHNTIGADGQRGTFVGLPSRALGWSAKNINVDRAEVKGLEVQGRWNLDSIGLPQGLYANWAATYQRGKIKTDQGNYPINALQPFNGLIGIGYEHPEKRWSLALNNSYYGRKNPKDTTAAYDRRNEVFPFAKHSRAVWVSDLVGHYAFGKHFTLRAGVFNLFDKQYYTWDSLRNVREFGAIGRVDNCGGAHATCAHNGIQRFSAPGRNFTVSLEAVF